MAKQNKKSVEQEQIEHPVVDIKTLRKNGKVVSVKSRGKATNRVIEVLKVNPNGLTQRMIMGITGMREQHINQVVRKLQEKGLVERIEIDTQLGDHRKTLIYNVYVGK